MNNQDTDKPKTFVTGTPYRFGKKHSGQLYLMPLCKSKENEILFIGTYYKNAMESVDFSKNIWKISPKGELEVATISNDVTDLSDLTFKNLGLKLDAKLEKYKPKTIFRHHAQEYNETINKYGQNITRRLQRFSSPKGSLNRMKLLTNTNRKRAIALATTAGIAITTAGILTNLLKDNANNKNVISQIQETDNNVIDGLTINNISKGNKFITDLKLLFGDAIQTAQKLEQGNKNVIEQIPEYSLLKKYSSTMNSSIEQATGDEIFSIEQFIENYEKKPSGSISAGEISFLQDLTLDLMKIKIANAYAITDWENILITYEDKGLCIEVRVRTNEIQQDGSTAKRDLETPAFYYNKLSINMELMPSDNKAVDRTSRLPIEDWETFMSIIEMDPYTYWATLEGKYTFEEYNKGVTKNIEELAGWIPQINENMKAHMKLLLKDADAGLER